MGIDVFGKALLDYQKGVSKGDLTTYLRLRGYEDVIIDTMSTAYLFRGFGTMLQLEQTALQQCRGKILDIGCGAGSHSLFLQESGKEVVALDSSPGAVETCRLRGLRQVEHTPVTDYHGTKFDTLLLLMNGIGISGRLGRLKGFLGHLKSLLAKNGQILLDSSDIRYMYQENESSTFHIPQGAPYYGEARFVMEYQGEKSGPFPWLYLDCDRLRKVAASVDLSFELVGLGDHFDYLAKLTHKSY